MFKKIFIAFLMFFTATAAQAMISKSGRVVPGYYTIEEDAQAVTAIQIIEGARFRIYDRRDSVATILIEGSFTMDGNAETGYNLHLKLVKQSSMDNTSGLIEPISKNKLPYKNVQFTVVRGMMYQIGTVTYTHADGHTSTDTGVLYMNQ